jgi:hypothetical protein
MSRSQSIQLSQKYTVWGVIFEFSLCTMLSHSTILKSAPPNLFPLCALLSFVKPKSALLTSQVPVLSSSIQWPMTAKYVSALDACHASHVKLTCPFTMWLYAKHEWEDE